MNDLEDQWATLFEELHIPWEFNPEPHSDWCPTFALWPQGKPPSGRITTADPIYAEVRSVWSPGAFDGMLDCNVHGVLLGSEPCFENGVLGWFPNENALACRFVGDVDIPRADDNGDFSAAGGLDTNAPCLARLHLAEMSKRCMASGWCIETLCCGWGNDVCSLTLGGFDISKLLRTWWSNTLHAPSDRHFQRFGAQRLF